MAARMNRRLTESCSNRTATRWFPTFLCRRCGAEVEPLPDELFRGRSALPEADLGQVPVALVHVEPVAHDEVRRDVEADVAQVWVLALEAVLHQQRADLEAGAMAGKEVAPQPAQREPAVHDVLDDEDVPVGE